MTRSLSALQFFYEAKETKIIPKYLQYCIMSKLTIIIADINKITLKNDKQINGKKLSINKS